MGSNEAKTTALYDRNLFLHKNQKTLRFNQLNPEVVRELFSDRPCFDYVREVAIARLEKTVNDQLNILTLEDTCDYTNMEQLSNNIFSWSSKDYLKRRFLKNCVWIDVIKIHSKEDCLTKFKLRTDLQEVKTFLKLIFEDLHKSQDNYDLETLICTPLREAERNLGILEILCDKKEELNEMLKEQKHLINARLHTKRSSKEDRLLFEIEESVARAQAWNPLQMRFGTNWYQCQTAQVRLRSDLRENDVQKEIVALKFKLFSEEMSGDTIRDNYYILVEQLKHDLEVLQKRFNIQLDEIDNKINYTRSEISKMVEQQKLLSEEIERFHEEIQNRLEKEESEREKKELERLRFENRRSYKRKSKKGAKKVRQKPKVNLTTKKNYM